MPILIILFAALAGFILLIWIGFRIQPAPFEAFPQAPGPIETIPLPDNLPEPVAHFYREIYGDHVPVITSVVLSGRASLRPSMALPAFPSRFRFTHIAGHDYRLSCPGRHRHSGRFTHLHRLHRAPALRLNVGQADRTWGNARLRYGPHAHGAQRARGRRHQDQHPSSSGPVSRLRVYCRRHQHSLPREEAGSVAPPLGGLRHQNAELA